MSDYRPDNWVVIKFTQQVKSGNTGYGRTEKVFYKVLGGWSGGYLDGDSWRMNSGGIGKQIQDAAEASGGNVKVELMELDDETTRKDWKEILR